MAHFLLNSEEERGRNMTKKFESNQTNIYKLIDTLLWYDKAWHRYIRTVTKITMNWQKYLTG